MFAVKSWAMAGSYPLPPIAVQKMVARRLTLTMPSRSWTYVAIGAATLGAVGIVELLSGPTLRPGDRILLVGDSLAVGLSTPLSALAKDHGIAFQAIAIVGTRIDQWAQSTDLTAVLAAFQPTVVLVSLGTNDAYVMPSPGTSIGQRQAPYMEALLTKIEAAHPRAIVWIEPPTLPDAASSLSSVRQLIEAQHAIDLPKHIKPRVALFASQRLTIVPRSPDGIHPVVSGYAYWAGKIWQWLT